MEDAREFKLRPSPTGSFVKLHASADARLPEPAYSGMVQPLGKPRARRRTSARADEGVLGNGDRHDQAYRTRQRVRVYSRQQWAGIFLSPQLRPGQLRQPERRPARVFRRGTV